MYLKWKIERRKNQDLQQRFHMRLHDYHVIDACSFFLVLVSYRLKLFIFL